MSPRLIRFVALALVALLAACGSDTGPVDSVFIPRHDSLLGVGDAAALQGRLVVDDDCLWVETLTGERYLALWPADTTRGMINLEPAILGPGGELLVESGSLAMLGGSETTREVAERLVGGIPQACASESFWVVGMVNKRP